MANYSYMNREYIPQEKTKQDTRFGGRDTTYTGAVEKNSDRRSRADFPEGFRDPVGRPVVVDSYVTQIETTVEQIHVPKVTPSKAELMKDYGGVNNGQNSSQDEPPRVENIRKVQTEQSRPSKPGLVSSYYWHQTPSSYSYGGTNDYGWNKPSGNTTRQPYFDNSFRGNDTVPERKQEPTMIATGGRTKPSLAPNDSPLTKPTNDIFTTVEYVKEPTRPPSVSTAPTQSRFKAQAPMKVDFPPIIDSAEAAMRYKGQVLWE